MESGSCRCHTSSFSTLGLEHCDFNTKLNKWLKIFIKFIFKSITDFNIGYFNFEQIFFKRAQHFLLQKSIFASALRSEDRSVCIANQSLWMIDRNVCDIHLPAGALAAHIDRCGNSPWAQCEKITHTPHVRRSAWQILTLRRAARWGFYAAGERGRRMAQHRRHLIMLRH